MPTIFFTDGNDTYTVSATGTYNLAFLDGDDNLTVDGGTFTTAAMGEGADVIILKSGDGLIYGDGGDDRFGIYAGGFEARGGSGNDTFNIRAGNDLILKGDSGDDSFNFYAGSLNALLYGGDGNDTFNGGQYKISGDIYGGAGNDTFVGFRNVSGTVPNLLGGTGNDVYRANPAGSANFIENANEGIDTVQVSAGRNYTLPANIENLTVGNYSLSLTGPATLTGNGLNNEVQGYNNAETINGLGGNDKLYGGGGADTLNGGSGNDLLDGQAGADTMAGGTGNDIYYINNASDVITELAGGGVDTLHTVIDYTLPAYVENGIIDNPNGASLTGNESNNVLTGGVGVDHLYGGAGNDILNGGANWDYMAGGAGDDHYYVDNARDFVVENPGEGTDTLTLNLILPAGDPFSPPPPPATYVIDPNVENLVVTQFGQSMYGGGTMQGFIAGNSLDNVITDSDVARTIGGGGGDDTIYGNGGNDYLIGGDGFDTVSGGAGDDTIVGDGNGIATPEGDTLTGRGGSDHFYYYDVAESAPFIFRSDQITDFETGSDTINLIVDADANTPSTQDWHWVGTPTGAAGELWIDSSDSANGNWVLFGDNNGDGLADLMIRIHGNGFAQSDVVL